jgi:hypothetical protein
MNLESCPHAPCSSRPLPTLYPMLYTGATGGGKTLKLGQCPLSSPQLANRVTLTGSGRRIIEIHVWRPTCTQAHLGTGTST